MRSLIVLVAALCFTTISEALDHRPTTSDWNGAMQDLADGHHIFCETLPGKSLGLQDIFYLKIGEPEKLQNPEVLLLAGLRGDEPALTTMLIENMSRSIANSAVVQHITVYVLPILNVDGYMRGEKIYNLRDMRLDNAFPRPYIDEEYSFAGLDQVANEAQLLMHWWIPCLDFYVLPYRSWDLTDPPEERVYQSAAVAEIATAHTAAILAYISTVTRGLSGSVLLQDVGTPADVEVVLTTESGARVAKTRTNPAGHFTLLALPGSYHLLVNGAAVYPLEITVEIPSERALQVAQRGDPRYQLVAPAEPARIELKPRNASRPTRNVTSFRVSVKVLGSIESATFSLRATQRGEMLEIPLKAADQACSRRPVLSSEGLLVHFDSQARAQLQCSVVADQGFFAPRTPFATVATSPAMTWELLVSTVGNSSLVLLHSELWLNPPACDLEDRCGVCLGSNDCLACAELTACPSCVLNPLCAWCPNAGVCLNEFQKCAGQLRANTTLLFVTEPLLCPTGPADVPASGSRLYVTFILLSVSLALLVLYFACWFWSRGATPPGTRSTRRRPAPHGLVPSRPPRRQDIP